MVACVHTAVNLVMFLYMLILFFKEILPFKEVHCLMTVLCDFGFATVGWLELKDLHELTSVVTRPTTD